MKNLKYYEILEVSPNSTMLEIHSAYQNAKNAYSSDNLALYSIMSQEESQELLRNIEEAYKALSCPEKRRSYDEKNDFNKDLSDDPKIYSNSSMPLKSQNLTFDNKIDQKVEIKNPNAPHKSVNKLVASNKYSLEFSKDNQFEEQIEVENDFSGELLKKVREYKNVTIERLAEMTKVSKRCITAIEEEDFSKLPASVYARGYIYQYAKCLKLNPDLVTSSYMRKLKEHRNE